MSQEDVDVIVRMYERGQNDEEIFSVCHPKIEWDMSRLMPDGQVYRGHAGVREFWRGWAGTWDDFEFSIDKIVDAGGGDVVVRVHQAGHWDAAAALPSPSTSARSGP